MIVRLAYNIAPILEEAGYTKSEDYGWFKGGWRHFHAIPIDDFSFDLHLDYGRGFGHGWCKDNLKIRKEIERIKKI